MGLGKSFSALSSGGASLSSKTWVICVPAGPLAVGPVTMGLASILPSTGSLGLGVAAGASLAVTAFLGVSAVLPSGLPGVSAVLPSGLPSVLPSAGCSLDLGVSEAGAVGATELSLGAGPSSAGAVSLGVSAIFPSGLASVLPSVGCSLGLGIPAAGVAGASFLSLGVSAALPSGLPSVGFSLGLGASAAGAVDVTLPSLGAGPSLAGVVSLGASAVLASGLASGLPSVGFSLGLGVSAAGVVGVTLPSLVAGLSLAGAVSLGVSAVLPSGLPSVLPMAGSLGIDTAAGAGCSVFFSTVGLTSLPGIGKAGWFWTRRW